jgi:hypothetical protein
VRTAVINGHLSEEPAIIVMTTTWQEERNVKAQGTGKSAAISIKIEET